MHIPVLLNETIDALHVREGGRYIDGTLGGGGHSEAILSRGGQVLGIDRDPAALSRVQDRFGTRFDGRFALVHSTFSRIAELAAANGFAPADGVLFDLGVSSFQLDEPERGFSFQHDGPLDMRMDTTAPLTAASLLADLGDDWRAMADLLRRYGEEPQAVRIAKAIVAAGARAPLRTTGELADVVRAAVGGRRGAPRDPATRTFQALRIAVNDELGETGAALEGALSVLAPGGRLAVITFHSLEDRIVKQTFARHAGRWLALDEGGERWDGDLPAVALPNRKPVEPGDAECRANPRARSARLRVAERLAAPPSSRVANRYAPLSSSSIPTPSPRTSPCLATPQIR